MRETIKYQILERTKPSKVMCRFPHVPLQFVRLNSQAKLQTLDPSHAFQASVNILRSWS